MSNRAVISTPAAPEAIGPLPVLVLQSIRRIARLDGTGLWLVAEEVRGIHIEALDHARCTELDHSDVMPFRALAATFPAVHPLAAVGVLVGDEDGLAGFDQVLLLGEEVIGTPQHSATEALGGEVDEVGEGEGLVRCAHC